MLLAAKQFVTDFKAWQSTPFLVLLGSSGAGKTHLATRIWEWFDNAGRWWTDRAGVNQSLRGDFIRWSDFIQRCREGDSSKLDDMIDDNLLVIDDLAATTETKGWMVEKLYRLLDHRILPFGLNAGENRKPRGTVITCNLFVEHIAEQYDPRIASRLLRLGKDKVIEVETMDWALR